MRNFAALFALASAVALGAATACHSSESNPEPAAAEAQQGSPFLPAGTPFMVRLGTPIGTGISSPGEFFTAQLVTPLRAPDGSIAPEGTVIRGRIIGAAEGPAANLRIRFSTLETPSGAVPLEATVSRSQPSGSPFRAQGVYSESLPYTAVLLPAQPPAVPPPGTAVGGGPSARLELPAGTPVELVLLQPLRLSNHGPPQPFQR